MGFWDRPESIALEAHAQGCSEDRGSAFHTIKILKPAATPSKILALWVEFWGREHNSVPRECCPCPL